ncbi:YcaO-like family protein [Enterobacterales bacterium AW_CKDN230030176-1A_HGKHYDSX7]
MNNFNSMFLPLEPDFQHLQPAALLDRPASIEYGSRWNTFGSSSDWGGHLAGPALGEFLERRHFYLDVNPDATKPLNDVLRPAELQHFMRAFAQTSTTYDEHSFLGHHFSVSTAIRLEDFTTCYVPTVCISLSATVNPEDNSYFPVRDTCGCSVHTDIMLAIFNSIKESLERQFLLKSWLTGTCTAIIDLPSAVRAISHLPSERLLRDLALCGRVLILDISDSAFPGCCIMACFGSPHSTAHVRFCAGMSYADDKPRALHKAITELWQTFRFMHSFYANKNKISELSDPYLSHFFSCNHFKTFNRLLRFSELATPPNTNELTLKGLLEPIRRLNLSGFIYLRQIGNEQQPFYACKYLSPRTFLHMNNAEHFNTENDYSDSFKHLISKKQLSNMVPFP